MLYEFTLSMSLPGQPQGHQQWRLNSTLLSDDNFVKFIQEEIHFFLSVNVSPEVSNLIVWDALKAYLRGQIIAYTARIKRENYKERSDITLQIREIDNRFSQTKCPNLYKKRLELKTKFDLLTSYHSHQLILKSKSLFYTYGDKSDQLFANQLRGFKAKQKICSIRMPNGQITTDPLMINDTFRKLYNQLYTSESHQDTNTITNFLNGLNIPKISLDRSRRLEEPISQAEIAAAVSSMQSNKCPGHDGFPAEFLKKFLPSLLPLLHSVSIESSKQGLSLTLLSRLRLLLLLRKIKTQLNAPLIDPSLF